MPRSGTVRLTMDNTGSNFPRRVSLSASDPDHAVRCTCTPAEINVAPNAKAVAEVRFTIPATSPGLHQTRLLTVAVDEHGRAPVTTTITVEQEGLPVDSGLADDEKPPLQQSATTSHQSRWLSRIPPSSRCRG